jgi:hypothetical protein
MTANAEAAASDRVVDGRTKEGARTDGRSAVRPGLVVRLRRVRPRRRLEAIGAAPGTVHQAAAALPHRNRGRATERLRDQLTIVARAVGLTPDWSTLTVTGPTEMTGTQHGARFEWTGRVAMRGLSALAALPDPDFVPQHTAANGDTVPFGVSTSWNGPRPEQRPGPAQPSHRRSASQISTRAAA